MPLLKIMANSTRATFRKWPALPFIKHKNIKHGLSHRPDELEVQIRGLFPVISA